MKTPTLSFTHGFDERDAFEASERGYCEEVVVHLPTGSAFKVCFYEPARLAGDLERIVGFGKACIGEPGLIVIPEVTLSKMQAAVVQLFEEGYFDQLLPLPNDPCTKEQPDGE